MASHQDNNLGLSVICYCSHTKCNAITLNIVMNEFIFGVLNKFTTFKLKIERITYMLVLLTNLLKFYENYLVTLPRDC